MTAPRSISNGGKRLGRIYSFLFGGPLQLNEGLPVRRTSGRTGGAEALRQPARDDTTERASETKAQVVDRPAAAAQIKD